ncbi:hypothetical protein INR49_032672, partial [Caranx melampygus]
PLISPLTLHTALNFSPVFLLLLLAPALTFLISSQLLQLLLIHRLQVSCSHRGVWFLRAEETCVPAAPFHPAPTPSLLLRP